MFLALLLLFILYKEYGLIYQFLSISTLRAWYVLKVGITIRRTMSKSLVLATEGILRILDLVVKIGGKRFLGNEIPVSLIFKIL